MKLWNFLNPSTCSADCWAKSSRNSNPRPFSRSRNASGPRPKRGGRATCAPKRACKFDCARDTVLAISGHQNLLDAEPYTQNAIRLRNPYIDPLNFIQVEMLRRLRALPDKESPEAEALRQVIVLTINGIAAGLKNTG